MWALKGLVSRTPVSPSSRAGRFVGELLQKLVARQTLVATTGPHWSHGVWATLEPRRRGHVHAGDRTSVVAAVAELGSLPASPLGSNAPPPQGPTHCPPRRGGSGAGERSDWGSIGADVHGASPRPPPRAPPGALPFPTMLSEPTGGSRGSGGICSHSGPSRDTRSLSWEQRPQSITEGTVFAACQVLFSQLVSRS